MLNRLMALLVLLCGVVSSAQAGIIEVGTEQGHIDYAADPIFQAAGWLAGYNADGGFFAGSAVLIAPDWVLTAGHVVDNPNLADYTSMKFSLSSSVYTQPPNYVAADAWYVLGADTSLFGADIALVHLAESITSVTPANLYTGSALPSGTHIDFAGYGVPGYYPTGYLAFDGIKRGGENLIDIVGNGVGFGTQYFTFDFGPADGTTSLALEMGGTSFDSGSPVFAFVDGQPQLIGINVRVSGLVDTFAIRPEAYSDWINQTTSVPEPSTLVLMLCGTSALWLASQKRLRSSGAV